MAFSLAFLTGSNALIFGHDNARDYESAHVHFYKTADYCLDDCLASCENIIWISLKRMYGIYYLSHNKYQNEICWSVYGLAYLIDINVVRKQKDMRKLHRTNLKSGDGVRVGVVTALQT